MSDSNFSDHDLLIRLDERTINMLTELKASTAEQAKINAAYDLRLKKLEEERVKTLEDWKSNLSGRLTAIIGLGGAVWSALIAYLVSKLMDNR